MLVLIAIHNTGATGDEESDEGGVYIIVAPSSRAVAVPSGSQEDKTDGNAVAETTSTRAVAVPNDDSEYEVVNIKGISSN